MRVAAQAEHTARCAPERQTPVGFGLCVRLAQQQGIDLLGIPVQAVARSDRAAARRDRQPLLPIQLGMGGRNAGFQGALHRYGLRQWQLDASDDLWALFERE